MKNNCNKTRSLGNPYEVWEAKGWCWKVLKKYQADDNKAFARAFCFVTSPFCPEGEYGDTYIKEYKEFASLTKSNYEPDKTNT